MIAAEMWYELIRDYNHWVFEALHDIFQFGIVVLIARPVFKRWLKNRDEKKYAHQHCEDVHEEQLSLPGMKGSK